jgi:hypothetical protein
VKAKGKYRWSSSFGRIYSVGGNEINAKTQRSEGAKRMKLDQSCLLNSNRNRPARETFFTCVLAVLAHDIIPFREDFSGQQPPACVAQVSKPAVSPTFRLCGAPKRRSGATAAKSAGRRMRRDVSGFGNPRPAPKAFGVHRLGSLRYAARLTRVMEYAG